MYNFRGSEYRTCEGSPPTEMFPAFASSTISFSLAFAAVIPDHDSGSLGSQPAFRTPRTLVERRSVLPNLSMHCIVQNDVVPGRGGCRLPVPRSRDLRLGVAVGLVVSVALSIWWGLLDLNRVYRKNEKNTIFTFEEFPYYLTALFSSYGRSYNWQYIRFWIGLSWFESRPPSQSSQ